MRPRGRPGRPVATATPAAVLSAAERRLLPALRVGALLLIGATFTDLSFFDRNIANLVREEGRIARRCGPRRCHEAGGGTVVARV